MLLVLLNKSAFFALLKTVTASTKTKTKRENLLNVNVFVDPVLFEPILLQDFLSIHINFTYIFNMIFCLITRTHLLLDIWLHSMESNGQIWYLYKKKKQEEGRSYSGISATSTSLFMFWCVCILQTAIWTSTSIKFNLPFYTYMTGGIYFFCLSLFSSALK